MLLEKSWSVGDVCTLKICSGEEVVAKITDVDDRNITISRPLVVQISMDPQTNRVGLQLLPGFVITADPEAKLKISMNNVLTITATEASIKQSYISNTTGLLMPTAGISSLLV